MKLIMILRRSLAKFYVRRDGRPNELQVSTVLVRLLVLVPTTRCDANLISYPRSPKLFPTKTTAGEIQLYRVQVNGTGKFTTTVVRNVRKGGEELVRMNYKHHTNLFAHEANENLYVVFDPCFGFCSQRH